MFCHPVRFLAASLSVAVAATFLASSALAQARLRDVSGQGKGLSINLVTSGYSFVRPATGDDAFSFLATATIFNRSRNDIGIKVPSTVGPNNCIIFKVYNEEGDEVWSSSASTSETLATITLPRGEKWKNTARVPLTTNAGVPLESGLYTLEASLAGGLAIGGSTLFEITGNPGALPGSSVVDGMVWQAVPISMKGQYTYRLDPVSDADVTILAEGSFDEEFLRRMALIKGPVPAAWKGKTGEQGGFEASISPGEYTIFAAKGPYSWFTTTVMSKPSSGPAFPWGLSKISAVDGATVRPVVMLGAAHLSQDSVLSVGQVTAQTHPTIPGYLLVDVSGTVGTEGWSNAILTTRELTSDGWLVLDFKAVRPTEAAAQVITPVAAKLAVPALTEIVGIRVRAETNTVDAPLALPE